MRCPGCGFENIEDTDVCAQCRRDLTETAAPAPDDPVEIRIMKTPIQELNPATPCQVAPDTPVGQVAQTMADKSIGCVLIADRDNLVGIFSERDLLFRVGANFKEHQNRPIRDFMTLKPVRLGRQDSIAFAMNHMDAGGCRHIPICEEGRLTGIISVRDIMSYLVSHAYDE